VESFCDLFLAEAMTHVGEYFEFSGGEDRQLDEVNELRVNEFVG